MTSAVGDVIKNIAQQAITNNVQKGRMNVCI